MTSAAGTKPVTSSAFYVLLALSESDRHGVGIADEVARLTSGVVELGPGTLYATLGKMLDRGLLATGEPPPGAQPDPRRRYYSITPRGRTVLEQEAERLAIVMAAVRSQGVLGRTDRS